MKTYTYGKAPFQTFTCYSETWNSKTHEWEIEPENVTLQISVSRAIRFPCTLTDPKFPPRYFNKPRSI